nr:succinylglutamate desuccinylase/aspartoacylase family protein [Marinicella sp. W31]MDC2877331.1 succinylglutamate desuccinylase/aspartoacylase family protein [Marinicella sp. W31]
MICIRGGDGPTALFTAGTHGDEYEGQIALLKLARELADMEIYGRVIILPALNRPAVMAGKRNSPLDGGNLNRCFPGDSNGGPTSMIAHYITSELFPLADLVIDVHSGGFSLDHLPLALARPGRTDVETAEIRKLLRSFAAPIGLVTSGVGGGGGSTLYAAAEASGIPALTTELGSGVTLSAKGLAIAETGLRRVLVDYSIADSFDLPQPEPMQLMCSLGPKMTIYAPHAGLFEPSARPGDAVSKGQFAGSLHHLDAPMAPPTALTFATDGLVTWRRFPTLSAPGDGLFGLMSEFND